MTKGEQARLVARRLRDELRHGPSEVASPNGISRSRHSSLMIGQNVISERTVSRYRCRRPRAPSQTWRTFLANHLSQVMSVSAVTSLAFRGSPRPVGTYQLKYFSAVSGAFLGGLPADLCDAIDRG